jgi:hypothetical protein
MSRHARCNRVQTCGPSWLPHPESTDGESGGNGRWTKYLALAANRNSTYTGPSISTGRSLMSCRSTNVIGSVRKRFFRQAFVRTEVTPTALITAQHQPIVRAVATVLPLARHVRSCLPRHHGYTTQPGVSHVLTRDRLRGTRELRAVHTGQRFVKCFEALLALRPGMVKSHPLVPGNLSTYPGISARDNTSYSCGDGR